jgi:hypothetical protein
MAKNPATGGLARAAVTAAATLVLLAAAPLAAQLTPIFLDGFESGNTLAWSASVGEPALAPAEVFRMSDLDLRDPHLYVLVPVFGCVDITDQDIPLTTGTAFNPNLQVSITGDTSPVDGILDSSFLLEFRPFEETAALLRLDMGSGVCTAPMAGTTCAPHTASLAQTAAYDGLAAGSCLAPIAGTLYGPYTPEVVSVAGPCFVSTPRQMVFDLNGVALPLRELQVAADWTATPVSGFSSGLMRGFLSESDAATVILPAELPIVGGQPLTALLPGGSGNCSTHDDRDSLHSVSGWWFYFNFPAAEVPWTGN